MRLGLYHSETFHNQDLARQTLADLPFVPVCFKTVERRDELGWRLGQELRLDVDRVASKEFSQHCDAVLAFVTNFSECNVALQFAKESNIWTRIVWVNCHGEGMHWTVDAGVGPIGGDVCDE